MSSRRGKDPRFPEWATKTISGYLNKLKTNAKNILSKWNRRWFVLDSEHLAYYERESSTQPLHIAHLYDVIHVRWSSSNTDGSEEASFEVLTGSRRFVLRAVSSDEAQRWMTALRHRMWCLEHEVVRVAVNDKPTILQATILDDDSASSGSSSSDSIRRLVTSAPTTATAATAASTAELPPTPSTATSAAAAIATGKTAATDAPESSSDRLRLSISKPTWHHNRAYQMQQQMLQKQILGGSVSVPSSPRRDGRDSCDVSIRQSLTPTPAMMAAAPSTPVASPSSATTPRQRRFRLVAATSRTAGHRIPTSSTSAVPSTACDGTTSSVSSPPSPPSPPSPSSSQDVFPVPRRSATQVSLPELERMGACTVADSARERAAVDRVSPLHLDDDTDDSGDEVTTNPAPDPRSSVNGDVRGASSAGAPVGGCSSVTASTSEYRERFEEELHPDDDWLSANFDS